MYKKVEKSYIGAGVEKFTTGQVVDILGFEGARTSIFHAEKQGTIPMSSRGIKRSEKTRTWTKEQLPEIGRVFGKFEALENPPVIVVHQSKGGVGKTALAANLARLFAFGIRATELVKNPRGIVVGLDSQTSITLYLTNPVARLKDLAEWTVPKTALDYLRGTLLEDIILPTDIPNLDILPESQALADLEKEIVTQTMRHKRLEELFCELRKRYDFIVVDTGPQFSTTSECALWEADLHVMPAACEIGCYAVMDNNVSKIKDWYEEIDTEQRSTLIVPTMAAQNKISKQILAAYMSQYGPEVSEFVVSRTIKGAEAESLGLSVNEYKPNSSIASEYLSIASEVWKLVGGNIIGS